jgi:hypothetical protein
MEKQTAVEWLENQLRQHYLLLDCEYILKKAKQMEREQIIEVAMYHKDSCVQRACVESYIAKHYGGQDESK